VRKDKPYALYSHIAKKYVLTFLFLYWLSLPTRKRRKPAKESEEVSKKKTTGFFVKKVSSLGF